MPAQTATETALDHVLDARALNHAESRALINLDTPEVDSLLELINTLQMPRSTRHQLLRHLTQVVALNEHEGTSEQAAAGTLEPTCRRKDRPHIKWIASELRDLLAADWATDGTSYVRAAIKVRELLANPHLPAGTLTGRTLAHELGDAPGGPASKLHQLVALIEEPA